MFPCRVQFSVQANDNGIPPQKATAGVQIQVSRNNVPPSTNGDVFQATIDESEPVNGTAITQIIATAPNLKVGIALYFRFLLEETLLAERN